MKNFKYPIINVFFDADQVPCVFVKEVKEVYPKIDEFTINYQIGNSDTYMDRDFDSFGWDINGKEVMAIADLQHFVRLYIQARDVISNIGDKLEEYDLSMISECDSCGKLIMPDDELYIDEDNNKVLCDSHSIFDDNKDYYVESNKVVHGTMRAFNKNSAEHYAKSLMAFSTEQADAQFKEFENNVPFTKWYYKIEIDDVDLTDTQKEIIKNLEETV